MANQLLVDPNTFFGSLITIFGTFVGLVVWLVKKSFHRQDSTNDRFQQHMERQIATHEATSERYAGAMEKLVDAVKECHDKTCKYKEPQERRRSA